MLMPGLTLVTVAPDLNNEPASASGPGPAMTAAGAAENATRRYEVVDVRLLAADSQRAVEETDGLDVVARAQVERDVPGAEFVLGGPTRVRLEPTRIDVGVGADRHGEVGEATLRVAGIGLREVVAGGATDGHGGVGEPPKTCARKFCPAAVVRFSAPPEPGEAQSAD